MYHKLKKFEKSIQLKEELYQNYVNAVNAKNTKDSITAVRNKKITMLSEIARGYFGLEQFTKAIESYKRALTFSPNDLNIRRNIAICQLKNGEVALATKELSALVQEGDKRSMELLQAIEEDANAPNIDIIIANLMSQRSTDLGQFTQFYLDRCAYKGVPPERIENGKYTAPEQKDLEVDMEKLEKAAVALGTARPGERSEFMLSLSKIIFDSQTNDPYVYRFLCRHFTSKADSAIYEGKALDTVKTYYLEALKVFDPYTEEKNNKQSFDEQDAVNAMYRYIYAQLGAGEVPLEAIYLGIVDALQKQKKQIHDACEKAFKESFKSYGNYDRILDAIRLLIATSPLYGSRRLLQILHEEPQWLEISVEYLKQLVEQTQIQSKPNFEEFAKAWQEAANLLLERENEVASQINLLRQFSLSNAWLTETAQRIDNLLLGRFSFELDKDYLRRLGIIIDDCITYQNANGFDDRIGRSSDLENKCRKLMEDIEKNPTKHAIEDIYEVVGHIRSVLTADIDRFYEENKPELTFDSGVNNYILKEDQSLDVQITIKNTGAGHAEQIELEISSNPSLYSVAKSNTISHGTVRAGAEETIMMNFIPTETAKTAKEFSFKVGCNYKTRRGEPMENESDPISVQIGSDEDFVPIKPNPYAQYASSDVVDNKKMFYGRSEFIEKAYEIICNNHKSFAISGQKRAGKSSVLHHLGLKLRENPNLIIVNVGNIGRLIDLKSKASFLAQLLWSILRILKNELTGHNTYAEIAKHIPDHEQFYAHITPAQYFEEIILNVKNELNKVSD
ncbi:MAG: tetratricopeptide repeat protein, partial [Saprospiraceae bacterium]|nr:tetratricopeptide repeat protein [Saprospiraceae bacterium]